MFDGSAHPLLRYFGAAGTGFLVTVLLVWRMIPLCRRRGWFEDTSQPDHAALDKIQSRKRDVPTMGGLTVIAGILVSSFLWGAPSRPATACALFLMLLLGAVGFLDDLLKLRGSRSRGLRRRTKLVLQTTIALLVGCVWLIWGRSPTWVGDPVTGWRSPGLGPYYLLWAVFVLVASSNAVNLADGLDGLAAGCAAIAAAIFFGLGLLTAGGLGISHAFQVSAPAGGEMCVLAAAVFGALLGFLWYNAHPAQIFMGDTGSQAIGGLLGFIGLGLKLDSLLFFVCAVFFIDEFTVAVQFASYRLTRRRIFPITPIHHYFQVGLGWPEQKITARFWIVAALVGFASAMLISARAGM